MPTADRRAFVGRAIAQFQRQDYPNKELIVIDDGADSIADLIPADQRIRFIRLPRRTSIGAKRNLACEGSKAPIIAHWDDDDWHAPHRLRYQVDHLLSSAAAICGIKTALFLDARDGNAWQYDYAPGQRPWLSGSSLVYTRAFWAGHRFPEINVGEDSRFVWSAAKEKLVALPDPTFHVGIIHGKNVSPKQRAGPRWKPYAAENIRRLLGEDWDAFIDDGRAPISADERAGAPFLTVGAKQTSSARADAVAAPAIRNVFACLVHESPECIVDLVRNLRFLDPSSVVLLYNGSKNPALLDGFPFSRLGAIVHPSPRPMAWGKLHDFALDCMRFALDELDFDTITNVDSDQLALRPGYSEKLAACLADRPGVGMLGNSPARQTSRTQIPPAKVAFAEIDLWMPLLSRFKDGQEKFVQWSFWPSTVYRADAARDLVRFFAEDAQLQGILSRSRIWATEEVMLPTITALLGHEIAANPCSDDYVKYRHAYTNRQMDQALARPDVFWAHPIPRRGDDPLRRQVRERHSEYFKPMPAATTQTQSPKVPGLLLTRPILSRMRLVEGWLDEDEADLLIAAAARALQEVPKARAVVEVGSYCGRATVVLASVVRAIGPSTKVWSIDPHDGRSGEADRIISVPPSFDKLRRNLTDAGVADFVEIVRALAPDTHWKEPIALLLIDGLHDYASVARDFHHFESWLAKGAFVAFHDYATYYPGVLAFVDELRGSGQFEMAGLVGSMIVLKHCGEQERAPQAGSDRTMG
jgi:hypothetical protein